MNSRYTAGATQQHVAGLLVTAAGIVVVVVAVIFAATGYQAAQHGTIRAQPGFEVHQSPGEAAP